MVTGSRQVHEVPIIGNFWPQGDPDRLHQAADIWLRLAEKVDDAQFHAHQHVVPVQANCQGRMIDALGDRMRHLETLPQANPPSVFVDAVRRIVATAEPPLRVPVGVDAPGFLTAALERRLKELRHDYGLAGRG